MKKLLGTLLALVLVMNVFLVNAFAATPHEHALTDEEIALLSDSSDMQLYCPNCGGMSSLVHSWSEWTYYYTYIWGTYSCDDCGNTWNTCIAQIPNATSEEDEKEDETQPECEVNDSDTMAE